MIFNTFKHRKSSELHFPVKMLTSGQYSVHWTNLIVATIRDFENTFIYAFYNLKKFRV